MNHLFLMILLVLLKISKQIDLEVIQNTSNKVLSRRKRFLIFPEGSSLQLVFCLTIPSVGMGNIFTVGWTAALAWELPHEPIHPFRKKENTMERVDKLGSSTSGGWTLRKNNTFSNKVLQNNIYYQLSKNYTSGFHPAISNYLMKPGYTKLRYSANPDTSYREYFKGKYVDYRPIYDALSISPNHKSNKVMKETDQLALHPVYKEVHRRTRRDLFLKIEKFLDAQRMDGKACILKAICEVSKSSNKKGTFMEELIKAIFKISAYKKYSSEDEYDVAADESHNCTQKYPRCAYSVWFFL